MTRYNGVVSTPSATFLSITPLVPTGVGLAEAVKFYQEQLGFSVLWSGAGMAGMRRGSVTFNLIENDNLQWIENCSMSISVTDLDGLYEEYRTKEARVGPLEVKAWGRREFHMIIPSGVCLQFYEQTDES